jgi:hypothetical protein
MKVGSKEKILLERETIILIISSKSLATILINPYMNRDTIYMLWLIFIFTQKMNSPRRMRKDKRSKENPMISQTGGNVVRHNHREKLFYQT